MIARPSVPEGWTTTIRFHDPVHSRGGAEPFKAMETTYTRVP